MKRFISLAIILLAVAETKAQQPVAITGQLIRKTKILTEIEPDPSLKAEITRDEKGLVGVAKKTALIRPFKTDTPPVVDPALQPSTQQIITAATATIGANFIGQGYTSVNPSDPVIVTGPNHVIQMINSGSGSLVKIFNKDGTQTIAQFNFNLITGITGSGDPVLLYDKLANRWLLTEFGKSGGVTTYINTLILAVSADENPLGSWYVYAYADNTFFVDFPKFAIWPDGYYATSNDFNTAGTSYLGSSVYAFDRTAMLSAAPTAVGIRTRLINADGRYFSMAPVTFEGITAPPGGSKGMFMYYTNEVFTTDPADVDSIYMITMTPDFVTPANTVISAATRFVATPFDDDLCAATRGQCIDQQTNTTTDLEDLAGRFSNRIVYRNFGTHQGIVTNFTVDVDGLGKGGIRWLEMRNTGASWSIYQEGTFSPDANERWLGSMTYDAVGNIGLVYNASGTTANPSIRFTARNPCDALGTMTLPETVIINGTASNSSTRYGDYNMLAIDPATDRDFWLTAQYNSATTWSTRIASFSLNNCSTVPKVRFYTNELLAYEDSLTTVGAGCIKYRDYTVNVVIDAAPSQPAIVTFNTTGSTANNGSDFTITPASVTLNSSTLSQPVTIRVFTDGNVEPPETIVLSYSINASGGDAVADNYNQLCTIKLFDNDKTITANQNTSILLTEGFGSDATPGPTSGTWTVSSTGSTNVWAYSGNLDAGDNGAAHITNNITTNPVAYTITTTATSRLRTPLINAATYNASSDTLKLFARYRCNGEFSGGTYYDYGYFMYSTDGTNFYVIPGTNRLQGVSASTDVTMNLPAFLNGTSFYLGFHWINDNSVGNNPPFVLDTMSVTATGVKIESTVSSTGTEHTTATQPVFFKSTADGELIASIANSTHISCLAASVPNAGAGRTAATINGNPAFRSNKVIQLTPSSAYAGSYSVTIYFTNAELAAWGGSANTLNILKVPDSDPLGATISGTVFDATVTDLSATRGYIAYTGIFTGFSKFLLTDAQPTALAINGLTFNVTALSKEIKLYWSTATEIDNRGFYIERSIDGTNFESIAFVNGNGNSNTASYYSYTDAAVQTKTWYYYRLRQVDFNNRASLSPVKKAIIDGRNTGLNIIPNPANDNCRLQIPELQATVNITVTDITGKNVVSKKNQSVLNGYTNLSIQHLANGVYTIKVVSPQGTYTGKLIKE